MKCLTFCGGFEGELALKDASDTAQKVEAYVKAFQPILDLTLTCVLASHCDRRLLMLVVVE